MPENQETRQEKGIQITLATLLGGIFEREGEKALDAQEQARQREASGELYKIKTNPEALDTKLAKDGNLGGATAALLIGPPLLLLDPRLAPKWMKDYSNKEFRSIPHEVIQLLFLGGGLS